MKNVKYHPCMASSLMIVTNSAFLKKLEKKCLVRGNRVPKEGDQVPISCSQRSPYEFLRL
jgi:hypothetical protein